MMFHASQCLNCGAPIYVREEDIAAGDPIAVYSCACFVQKDPAPKAEDAPSGRWEWLTDSCGTMFVVPKGETEKAGNFVGSYCLGGWHAFPATGANNVFAYGKDGKLGLLRALVREGVITEAEAAELGLAPECLFKWLQDDENMWSLCDTYADTPDSCYGYFTSEEIWVSLPYPGSTMDAKGRQGGAKGLLNHKLTVGAITEAEYRHLLDTAPKHDKPRN